MKKILLIAITLTLTQFTINPSVSLPPPEDIPEEILRTQIITQGRSVLNGEPLTAAEYAKLEADLEEGKYPPEIASQIRHIIFLLEIRSMINTFIPF